MKYQIKLILLISILSGCVSAPPKKIDINTQSPKVGEVNTVHVGDVLFEKVLCFGDDNGYGNVFKGECNKYDLSVTAILKDKFTLQYSEYMKPKLVGTYASYYRFDDAWLIKSGFTKVFEYPIDSTEINFKSNVFSIQSKSNNSITYSLKNKS